MYLADSEEEGSRGGEASIRPQTALMSLLNRLLPAVETFLLVHTSDLLSENHVEAVMAAQKAEKAHPVSSSSSSSNSSSGISSNVSSQAVLASVAGQSPGYAYRTTMEYARNHLSLYSDGRSDEDQRSFCKQISMGARQQSGVMSFSALASAGNSFSGAMTGNLSRSQRLLSFVASHKGVLNLLVKSKPQLLESSFASLVRITQLRPHLLFENKRRFFFSQLKQYAQKQQQQQRNPPHRRGLHLQIRRNQIFEDTFQQLRSRTAEEMRGRMQVNFYGEDGVDAGGLTREWYTILSREIFNPNYALFTAAIDGATFQPNPMSNINSNHLDYFKFVGRVIGKAVTDSQLMDAHFTRSFYKHVLGNPVDFIDIEATEPDYYSTLKQILQFPLESLMIDLTFSAEIQRFGRTEVVDLVPDGRRIPVTDENKADYVRLIAHHRMTAGIRAQIDAFLTGFYELVPAHLIGIFSPPELELLICGLPEVSVEDLQGNTEYHQYKIGEENIRWFWEILHSFNRQQRASFLQFVTGTSKVPLGGFSNLQGMRGTQRFSIHRAYGEPGLLPSAHTCFNQLDLPVYASQEELKEKLLMAIMEGNEGFGFA